MSDPNQEFQVPRPPPYAAEPTSSSMSAPGALAKIFYAPGQVFESFRQTVTFTPAAVRFLIAAPIIIVALLAYSLLYIQHLGGKRIWLASKEASPGWARLDEDMKEFMIQVQKNPAFAAVTPLLPSVKARVFPVIGFFVGAAIYLLGVMIVSGRIKYMQALLVWTYSALPPAVLWVLLNTVALFVRPPESNVAIALGESRGVIPINLGALIHVEMLPVPIMAVALSAVDLFEFYGLGLATLGLRKVARISWLASLGIVVAVWLLSVLLRVGFAGMMALAGQS